MSECSSLQELSICPRKTERLLTMLLPYLRNFMILTSHFLIQSKLGLLFFYFHANNVWFQLENLVLNSKLTAELRSLQVTCILKSFNVPSKYAVIFVLILILQPHVILTKVKAVPTEAFEKLRYILSFSSFFSASHSTSHTFSDQMRLVLQKCPCWPCVVAL